jgi:hypothetical protein
MTNNAEVDENDPIEQLNALQRNVFEDLTRWAAARGFGVDDAAPLMAAYIGELVRARYPDDPPARAAAVRSLVELMANRAQTPIITRGLVTDGAGEQRH